MKFWVIEFNATIYSKKPEVLDIIKSILTKVSNKFIELDMGIVVLDVQLKRIDYNSQVQSKLFYRMISEQNMIAEKYRAQGEGKKQEILGSIMLDEEFLKWLLVQERQLLQLAVLIN